MLHQKSLVVAPIHAKTQSHEKKDGRGNGENPSSLYEKTSSNAAPPHFKLFFSRYFFHEVGSTIIFMRTGNSCVPKIALNFLFRQINKEREIVVKFQLSTLRVAERVPVSKTQPNNFFVFSSGGTK